MTMCPCEYCELALGDPKFAAAWERTLRELGLD